MAEGMLFAELARGILFAELAKAVDGWLWHRDKIGNKMELGFDYFGGLVVERAKDRMENIDDEVEPIALCGLPL
jgi:hypothetical protein